MFGGLLETIHKGRRRQMLENAIFFYDEIHFFRNAPKSIVRII